MYYLDGKATEALNEVNEVTVFLSTKCLPGKFYTVHSWTNFRKKFFFFLFAWSVVQDTTLTGGAQPLAVGGSLRAQVSLLTPRSPVQNRHLVPACNTTASPLSHRTAPLSSSFNFLLGKSRTLLGSGLTLWPGTEVPRVPHTGPVPEGLRACPALAADLPACGSSAIPALSGSVPGGIDYLRV